AQLELRRLQRSVVSGRDFARDPEMAETVRPVRGDVELEDRIAAVRFERIDGETDAREPLSERRRLIGDVDELPEPVVADLHLAVPSKLFQKTHVVLEKQLEIVDVVLQHRVA